MCLKCLIKILPNPRVILSVQGKIILFHGTLLKKKKPVFTELNKHWGKKTSNYYRACLIFILIIEVKCNAINSYFSTEVFSNLSISLKTWFQILINP